MVIWPYSQKHAHQVFTWVQVQPKISRPSWLLKTQGEGWGAPSWLGRVHGPVNGLFAGGLLGPTVKSRGKGKLFCTDTSTYLDLGIWVPNNFVIDCFFFQLFKLTWMFCVDMASCWRGSCHVHAFAWVASCFPCQEGGQITTGTVLDSAVGMFLGQI